MKSRLKASIKNIENALARLNSTSPAEDSAREASDQDANDIAGNPGAKLKPNFYATVKSKGTSPNFKQKIFHKTTYAMKTDPCYTLPREESSYKK